jgi:hypothetical protein
MSSTEYRLVQRSTESRTKVIEEEMQEDFIVI